jgi:hypothetical protein
MYPMLFVTLIWKMTVLKVSVHADGTILADGRPCELDALDPLLAGIKEQGGQVWYHRETASGEPPPQAMAVIQRVVHFKVPVSMSSKPDFSDYVDGKGVSRPRSVPVQLRMPDVALRSDIEDVFAMARRSAREGLVIVRPDRMHLVMPRMAASDQLKPMAEGLSKLIPPGVQRNIAAIANTVFESASPGLEEVSKSIPFLGMLTGFTYIGHAVWVFEGHSAALPAGCRGADVLIVDSAMRPLLPAGWEDIAAGAMRNANILVHNRTTFQLGVVRKVGKSGALEFAE